MGTNSRGINGKNENDILETKIRAIKKNITLFGISFDQHRG